MVKNSPSNAGDAGSIPARGTKIPHAAGQLSPCATTTEPTCPGAHTPQLDRENLHTTTREKPVRHNERSHMPQGRSCVLQRSLGQEDPTCHGATKPASHNYWACTPQLLEPTRCNSWARVPQLLKPTHLEPVLRNKRSHGKEKPAHRNEE